MNRPERQMREDRAVRNAARALVDADIAQLKNTFSGKSLAKRVTDRVSEGSKDIFEEAVDAAEGVQAIIAASRPGPDVRQRRQQLGAEWWGQGR